MSGFLRDLRCAFRLLAKSPAFTAVAVLTLAIGIAANTAIFSAVYPILFAPLPYRHANRILMIWDIFQGERSDITFHTFREVSARSYSFEAVGVLEPWRPTMSGLSQPALGASRAHILAMMLGQGMLLTILGSLIGLAGAAFVTRAMAALLFGVSRFDPITYFGVIGLLALVSAAACWAPAWRATKIDPNVALRYE